MNARVGFTTRLEPFLLIYIYDAVLTKQLHLPLIQSVEVRAWKQSSQAVQLLIVTYKCN